MVSMRTTVDIPDELLRRAKSEAALRGRKLKDLIYDGGDGPDDLSSNKKYFDDFGR